MKNYRRLNLPPNPLKDVSIATQMFITGGYNLRLPKDVLNNEIMEIFNSMGLKPTFVSFFGRNDKQGEEDTRMIHADIKYIGGNAMEKTSWKSIFFGINWELLDSENTFSWWNMAKIREAWPDEEMNETSKYKILNGIHYSCRGNRGIPEGAIKIDEMVINGPTLVRTDIPHMTVYRSSTNNRVGISVRFDESRFSGWSDVYDFFKPYAID